MIFTEVLPRSLAALLGALLIVIFGLLYGVFSYEEIFTAISMKMLIFIMGLFIVVEILDDVGLFRFIGFSLINLTSDPRGYMILFPMMTLFFAAIIDNIPAMLIAGSLIMAVCKELKIDPADYIIAAAIFTNIGGITLLISSIPNILVGFAFDIGFMEFANIAIPLALILAAVTLILFSTYLLPKKRSVVHVTMRYDPWSAVKDKRVFNLSVIIFVAMIILLVFQEKLGVGMEFITFGASIALLVLTRESINEIFKRVDWPTLLFLAGFLIIVSGLDRVGLFKLVATKLTSICADDASLTAAFIGLSGIASGFVDNIPITAALIPVARSIIDQGRFSSAPLLWSLIFGANLGGNLTPIGSPSNIIALGILEKGGYRGLFKKFLKIGGLTASLHLLLAAIYTFSRFIFKIWP